MDISAFCDLLDWSCASVAIASRQRQYRAPHNVLLPRSWIFRVQGHLDGSGDIDLNEGFVLRLFDGLRRLLHLTLSGAGQGLSEAGQGREDLLG
jgi:hypothetical protein